MSETRAVAKAILVHEGKLLILRRSENDVRRPSQWDLPGGAIDPGEDIKQACAREILEEVGQTVAAADLHIMYAFTEPISEDISGTWLFLRGQAQSVDVMLSHEHYEARWVTLQEAIVLITYDRQLKLLGYIQEHDLLNATTSD